MGSFKFRLVAFFALISLLPLAAAYRGFHAVATENESSRADAVLEVSLRAALAAYRDQVESAARTAGRLAREPSLQEALAEDDRRALERIVATRPDVRIVTANGGRVGRTTGLEVRRRVAVVDGDRRLGEVVASLPIDGRLTARLNGRAGAEPGDRVVFARGGRVVAGGDLTGAVLRVSAGRPEVVSLHGRRYRALGSAPLAEPSDTTLAVLRPQERIDRAVETVGGRLLVALLGALLLIAALAYLEGRAIVRTLGRLANAARALAQGSLGERVPVRGKDEFAQVARAFNEMAEQLESRMRELEAERRRLRESTMRFGEALAATTDIDQLRRVVVETAVEATGATGGYLDGVKGDGFRAGRPDAGRERIRFPLMAGEESFGTLVLCGDSFTKEHRETVTWLVGHAVIGLRNARQHRTFEKQALVDPLTGLANRRLCEAAMETELTRAERFSEPLALVLVDLDKFKAINDRHGHPVGDDVLRKFAGTLRESLRDIDLAGRWGGEEFALLLPGTDTAGGVQLAERVRRSLEEAVMEGPGGVGIPVTASFGVASYPAARAKDELVAASDAALYEAKRLGRNRVEAAGEPEPAGRS